MFIIVICNVLVRLFHRYFGGLFKLFTLIAQGYIIGIGQPYACMAALVT